MKDGGGGGGADQGGGEAVSGQAAGKNAPGQPEVAESPAGEEITFGGQLAELVEKRAGDFQREGVGLEPVDGGGQLADGGVGWRGRRVAALAAGDELQGAVGLFGGIHPGHRPATERLGKDILDHESALVENPGKADTAVLEQGRRLLRPAQAHDLLILAEEEPGVATGPKTIGQEQLNSLKQATNPGLHIQGAAAPDESIGHGAGEGGVGPAALGAGFYWDNILVADE